MIIDSILSFERYNDLHSGFSKVYDFIRKHDLHSLESGKYVIEANNIWCEVSESEAKDPDNAQLLVHDSFIDIHLVLEGTEIIGYKDRSKCSGDNAEYDEAMDVAVLKEEPEVFVSCSDGNFVICFPRDAHAPLMGEDKIKKALFKVRCEKI